MNESVEHWRQREKERVEEVLQCRSEGATCLCLEMGKRVERVERVKQSEGEQTSSDVE
jgi:hypothetical protein